MTEDGEMTELRCEFGAVLQIIWLAWSFGMKWLPS